ncbi:putative transcriptional regulator, TetR [Mycobacteroides abscessus subsp. abscessus]|nr:putative transcriptional regulator, TetR [Mycobacteroides abscessus subsp. abscessus]
MTLAQRQRAKRAELVREEVIEAALAEFAERGYHQTSISHIAKRLGSGHSMFYRYFENKRDIVDHAVRQMNGRLLAVIGDRRQDGWRRSPSSAITCWGSAWPTANCWPTSRG